MKSLDDYAPIIGESEVSRIRRLALPLQEKSVAHVSSTFYGGGVAELLSPLILLMNDAGVRTEWRIFRGSPDFFQVTKKMHNALQGDGSIRLSEKEKNLYEGTAEENTRFTRLEGYDCVIVHDPQPAPLVLHYPRARPWLFKPLPEVAGLHLLQKNQPWVWRCHVDLSSPNMKVWGYVRKFASKYERIIVSSEKYRTGIRRPHSIIRPAIDPLSPKNLPMEMERARRVLERNGIGCSKPIVSQVSRFDRWKDPLGVIRAYRSARKIRDCSLVLLGSPATDDPEGDAVLRQVESAAAEDDDIYVVSRQSEELVNALQTASSVVVQKSLREGFGLTVSEALWKGRPVVAGNAGGIPLQVQDGKSGFLVSSEQECAQRIAWLLSHPKEAAEMGKAGREHVRKNFLIPRLLGDYLSLLSEVCAGGPVEKGVRLPSAVLRYVLSSPALATRTASGMLPALEKRLFGNVRGRLAMLHYGRKK